jgi:hypothetical protein
MVPVNFKFSMPLNTFMTVRCTEASSMYIIKGPYTALRPALKGQAIFCYYSRTCW